VEEREALRTGFPLTIPDSLLASEAMRQACTTRNFGEIFRLVNRRTGTSYAEIAAAVGKMTSSRVSDIVRGVRGVRGQTVIERICDGFGIHGEMLDVPPRQWERGSPVEGDPTPVSVYPGQDQESSEAHCLPDPDSFLISVWLEGRRQVVSINRRELIAGITGSVMRGAGAIHAPARQSASTPIFEGARIDAAVDHLKDMWHALVKADNLFGPRHALASVRQQLSIIKALVESSRRNQRMEVLKLAAQYAESASWLHEDSGDMASASRWASQAMEWAVEADDQKMITWALFRRSQHATSLGSAAQAIGLAQAAQRNDSIIAAPMRAAMMQQEAHGHALDGDEIACHRLLDRAHEFAASAETTGDARSGHGDFCTASYIEARRGACWLSLSRPDLAVPALENALSDLPDVYQRDRGFTQARLAVAYIGIREYEEAANSAALALDVARSSGSVRTLNEVLSAVNALGSAPSSATASELFDAIRETPEF
jgi:tetratricopeptide (TPR) repeat protein